MNRSRAISLVLVPVALALSLTLSPAAFAAHRARSGNEAAKVANLSYTAFTFGLQGGNIRPWNVSIAADGTVSATNIGAGATKLPSASSTIGGLSKLAKAERLNTFPSLTLCPGVNPDVASRFITLQTATHSRKVAVHGNCKTAFNQLFAVLYAIANVGTSTT